jgi:hypothetical protein
MLQYDAFSTHQSYRTSKLRLPKLLITVSEYLNFITSIEVMRRDAKRGLSECVKIQCKKHQTLFKGKG